MCQSFLGTKTQPNRGAGDLVAAMRRTVGALFSSLDGSFPLWSTIAASQPVTAGGENALHVTLTTTIPASPEEIYRAWLDSLAHSKMTGGAANMSEQIGAEVSALGRLYQRPQSRIGPGRAHRAVVAHSEFAERAWQLGDHDPAPGGRRGDFVDARARQCAGRTAELRGERLARELFRADGGLFYRAQARTAATSPAKAAPKTAPKRATKTAHSTKRAAGAKSKRASPRAKASPSKRKSKGRGKTRRAAAAAPARKRAKLAKNKPGRGKGR